MPRAAPVIRATFSFGIGGDDCVTSIDSFGRRPGSCSFQVLTRCPEQV